MIMKPKRLYHYFFTYAFLLVSCNQLKAMWVYNNAMMHMAELMSAIVDNNIEKVIEMLQKGVSANAQHKEYQLESPLHRAAEGKNLEMVMLLLHAGSKVDTINRYGETPLHKAAKTGIVPIAQAFIRAGALIDQQDFDGYAPLSTALRYANWSMVEFLIRAGANPDIRGKCIITDLGYSRPLGAVVNSPRQIVLCLSDIDSRLDLLRLLVNNTNINQPIWDESGNTALHILMSNKMVHSVKFLFSLPSLKTGIKNNAGKTAFDLKKGPYDSDIVDFYHALVKNRLKLDDIRPKNISQLDLKLLLNDAIGDGNTLLLKFLLSLPSSVITKAELDKSKSLCKPIENQFIKDEYKEIGRMLIQYLRFTLPDGMVSKSGMMNNEVFPKELMELIKLMQFA